MAHYAFLNNDQTTETLREELSVLWSEMGTLTSIEEPTEEDTAAIEAKKIEIDAKQQEIDNCLCVVTAVITGVSEIKYEIGSDEEFEQEIEALHDKKRELEASGEKKLEERIEVEKEIKEKIEERGDIPPTETDDTDYWEGYYGKGQLCKRTSFNTLGGAHQLGGTPFRKNYAGVGDTYDPVKDAFYAPQPYESWTLNEESCMWEAPVEKTEGDDWWKEDTTEWVDYEYYSQPYNSEPPYPSWSWSTESGWTAPVEKVEGKDYWHEGEQVWTVTNVTDPKPYPSWTIQDIEPEVESQHLKSGWAAPIPKPNDGNSYLWDEENLNWIEP